MKASIVMPTYNSVELLIPCLYSLNHQIVEPGDSFEVIVVDDGSDDGTREAIEHFQAQFTLHYIYKERSEDSSRSSARNVALEQADGELLIFLDGDHLVPPHYIREHLKYHRVHEDLVVLGFRNYLNTNEFDIDQLKEGFSYDLLPSQTPADRLLVVDNFSEKLNNLETVWYFFFTCNASVRRQHIQEIGGFHEGFQGWGLEDCELAYRLYKKDLTFVYAKDALIYHLYHPSEYDENRYQNWLKNMYTFQELHPSLDVRLLELLELFFNPDIRMFWFDSYLRFEYAVRAANGRLPYPGPVSVYTLKKGIHEDVLRQIQEEANERIVFVIDETDHLETSISLMCMKTHYDVMVYQNPSSVQKEIIFRQVSKHGIWRHIDKF